jgi:hypothetical protein
MARPAVEALSKTSTLAPAQDSRPPAAGPPSATANPEAADCPRRRIENGAARMKRAFVFICAIATLIGLALALSLPPPALAAAVSPNQMFGCNQSQIYDASTSGATRLVVGTATQQIYVCGFNFWSAGTVNVSLVYGTGGTCGTGQTKITPAFQYTAQTGTVDHLPVYTGLLPAPVSNDVCILTSAGTAVQAIVYYTQF